MTAPDPVNDRLFEQLLRPVVELFYATAKALAQLPAGEPYRTERAFNLGRLDALEQAGDLIAGAILVAFPDWAAMRDLALAAAADTTPGTAAPSPAAVPDLDARILTLLRGLRRGLTALEIWGRLDADGRDVQHALDRLAAAGRATQIVPGPYIPGLTVGDPPYWVAVHQDTPTPGRAARAVPAARPGSNPTGGQT